MKAERLMVSSTFWLLGGARHGDTELTGFSIQIRTLDPKRLSGVRHPPPVMLKNRGNVVALEPGARLPQVPGRNKGCDRVLEPQDWEHLFDLNRILAGLGCDAFNRGAELSKVAWPVQRCEQGKRRLGERPRRRAAARADVVQNPLGARRHVSQTIPKRRQIDARDRETTAESIDGGALATTRNATLTGSP